MRVYLVRLLLAFALLVSASAAATAQSMPADAPNARDHAVLSRYAGSWLVAQDVKEFDQASLPAGSTDVVKLEGRVTRLFYLTSRRWSAPAHRSRTPASKAAADGASSCCASSLPILS